MAEQGSDFLKAISLKKSRHSGKLLSAAFASVLVNSARTAGSAICTTPAAHNFSFEKRAKMALFLHIDDC